MALCMSGSTSVVSMWHCGSQHPSHYGKYMLGSAAEHGLQQSVGLMSGSLVSAGVRALQTTVT